MEDDNGGKEHLWNAIVEKAFWGVVVLKNDGVTMLSMNAAFSSMHGYAHAGLLDASFLALFAPDEREHAREQIVLALKTKRQSFNSRSQRKDGSQFPSNIDLLVLKIDDGSEALPVAFVRDITEQAKLEEQALHSQVMEAVGQLAGGIAHDFNNILTTILGCGHLLKIGMNGSDAVHESYLDMILSSVEKASELTKNLLTFSRNQVIDLKKYDLNVVVANLSRFIEKLLEEHILFEFRPASAALFVMLDVSQIEQALRNLAINAREAMPQGGRLRISTELLDLDEQSAARQIRGKAGQYALLCVSDAGRGIDGRIQQRIFEPFFTTKEVGNGPGLGLSIVHGIISQHGGHVAVDSRSGHGTNVRIYLPVVDSQKGPTTQDQRDIPARGTETILVAEDDAAARGIIRRMLEEFGYTVIEAVNGGDAVRKFEMNKDIVSLVIMDVVMPLVGGRQAALSIRSIRPHVKVLFMSGYPGEVMHGKGILAGDEQFLSKPISFNDLFFKIRQLLNEQGEKSEANIHVCNRE